MGTNKRFATAINCMDGRVQKPVMGYMIKKFKVDFVDMITEPGPNKILAKNSPKALIQSIKSRVKISVNKHHSKVVAVVGHHDCAGNPANISEQKKHLVKAMDQIHKWNMPINEIVGLWVNSDFKVAWSKAKKNKKNCKV